MTNEDLKNAEDFGGYGIAIVGMANRFPGASSPDEFWQNLRDGVESVTQFTDEQLAERGVAPHLLRNPAYVKAGCPLQNMDHFDPEFFGFSPKEAAILDPQHRQFYECCWEALERAGHPPSRFDGAIGVFAGSGMAAYFAMNLLTNPELVESVGPFLLRHTGNDKDFLATRVSYCVDLTGPSINVQTACSTSAVAVHLACQSLLNEECDMALAGGVTIDIPHGQGYLYKEGEILSPDGHCRAFDHRSKGTIFGSGAGAVVLRRLPDAIANGDYIHGVIIGSAVNNDGSNKVGYLAPSVDGQVAAVTEALELADVEADSIGYIECHGTGTPVGDPIEITALSTAFRRTTTRQGFCGVGSVKTNIGHLDTAAGVAGLIKATMALEHKQIPASLNYEAPNPSIDFGSSPFYVNDSLREWQPSDEPRRAAVNSLGVGGTNAFIVIEEAPARKATLQSTAPFQLLSFSAKNRNSLDAYAEKLASFLEQNPEVNLADVAFTLQQGREHLPFRRALAVENAAEAIQLLRASDERRIHTNTCDEGTKSLTFMFPGGGVQYAAMGRDLLRTQTEFRKHMEAGFDYLKDATNLDYHEILYGVSASKAETELQLQKPSIQLPLIFLVEYSLAQQWMSEGFEPAAFIGHSMGENTAACLAGVMSFEDALGLVLLRGQLMDDVPAGGMLSVYLSAAQLESHLFGDLAIAAINSPMLSVASGPQEQLDQLAAKLTELDIDNKPININIAAHSSMLDGILEPFRQYLDSIKLNAPNRKLISNLTGLWMTKEQATSSDYWVQHLRNTVQFSRGIDTLLASGEQIFLEVGPGSALSSLTRQHKSAPAERVFASLRHPQECVDDRCHFTFVKGKLWSAGYELNSTQLWPGEDRRRIPLPTYAFQHRPYWYEPGRGADSQPTARGLNRIDDQADWLSKPVWMQQGVLSEKQSPQSWLIFLDECNVMLALAEDLRARGHQVTTVAMGDSYLKEANDRYRLSPEEGLDGYRALVDDLLDLGRLPDRVLHGWLLTQDESFRPGSNFLHRNLECGFYSLFFLARAIADAELLDQEMHWLVYTNGSQRVADESLLYPEKATAFGACKAIPRELPGVSCAIIDIELPSAKTGRMLRRTSKQPHLPAKLLPMMRHELTAGPHNGAFAYRGDVRYALHFEPLQLSESNQPHVEIKRGSVLLITGGLGGIGNALATQLLSEKAARIAVVNRTPLPDKAEWTAWLQQHPADDPISRSIRTAEHLHSLSDHVQIYAGDVVDRTRMREIVLDVQSTMGKIDGVIHAAGQIGDSLIQMKSPAGIEEVFAAKIYGTLVLEDVLKETSLDFFVVFSSTSTVIAPVGQIDYIAANDFLNAFAISRSQMGKRVVSLNWGVWNEVGMAASAAAKLGGDAQTAPEMPLPTTYPLFTSATRSTLNGRERFVFSMQLSTSNWLLDEHRLKSGEAILPGTAFLELARAALRELGIDNAFEISELVFLKALHVQETHSLAARIVLRETPRGYTYKLQSEYKSSDGKTMWQTHAEAQVAVIAAAPQDETLNRVSRELNFELGIASGPPLLSRQESHLRFGPNWQVLRRLSIQGNTAIAQLELGASEFERVEAYRLHPGLLDIATGFAMDLIAGYAQQAPPEHLWVPISYQACRVYGDLPAHIYSVVRGAADNSDARGVARFDITIYDAHGNVRVEVTGLTIKKMVDAIELNAEPASSLLEPDEPARTEIRSQRELSASELAFQHMLELGIRPAEGAQAFINVLEGSSEAQVIVSSIGLDDLRRETQDAAKRLHQKDVSQKFGRPELESAYTEPIDEIETILVGFWEDLLGVDGVGTQDSFFGLGGHSLNAVRLFAKIQQTFQVDFPISVLFEAPTIAACAQLIRDAIGQYTADVPASETKPQPAARYQYLVPMHAAKSESSTPYFLVAGMFGNVLNLRHLAQLVGDTRPFYGLQAKGLLGNSQPHATFEEMATDYIAEMLTVQPEGPYMLGGFSGGGITAYEIARQLIEAGHEVSRLILLDTPLPYNDPLSRADRMSIHWQRVRTKGLNYFREWAENRYDWELQKFRKRFSPGEDQLNDPAAFQSSRMEVAFYQALSRYSIQALDVPTTLYRPKLPVEYHLSGGRVAREDRQIIMADNGWSRYIVDLEVDEVPGDHDSMVLEPNVRILSSRLRRRLDASDGQTSSRGTAQPRAFRQIDLVSK